MVGPKKSLGSHPEINTFYDDVAGLKRGGRRKARKAKHSEPVNKNVNTVHVHLDSKKQGGKKTYYQRSTNVKRLMEPQQTFAAPANVSRPSYYAVAPGVGNYETRNAKPLGVDEAHPGHYMKQAEVGDPRSVLWSTDTNRYGLAPVDSVAKRVQMTPSDRKGGVFHDNPALNVMGENGYSDEAMRKRHQMDMVMAQQRAVSEAFASMDGKAPMTDYSHRVTGAQGNLPEPRSAQDSAPRASSQSGGQFFPQAGQLPPSREDTQKREAQRELHWMDLPVGAAYRIKSGPRAGHVSIVQQGDVGQKRLSPLLDKPAHKAAREALEASEAAAKAAESEPMLRRGGHPVRNPVHGHHSVF